jgi:hypothetical protein
LARKGREVHAIEVEVACEYAVMWLEGFWEGWKDTSDQLIAGGVSTFLRIILRLWADVFSLEAASVLALAECNVCDRGWSLELGLLKAGGMAFCDVGGRRRGLRWRRW